MTDILDRLFDRSYDLEETLHDAHTEIVELRAALVEISHVRPAGATPNPLLNQVNGIATTALRGRR